MGLFFNRGDTKCTYQTNVDAVNQLLDTYVKSSQQEVLDLIQMINNFVIGDITNNSGDINITVLQSADSQNIQQADIMIDDILNSKADAGVKLDAVMNVIQQCSSNKLLDMSKHDTEVLNSLDYNTLTDLTQIIYNETCITANIGASQNVTIGDITNNSGKITIDVNEAVAARSAQLTNVIDTYRNEYQTNIEINTDYKAAIDNWSENNSALPDMFNNILLIILSPIIIIVLIFLLVIAYNLLVKPLVNKNKPNNVGLMPYGYYPPSPNQQFNPSYLNYPSNQQYNLNYKPYPSKQIEYPITSNSTNNTVNTTQLIPYDYTNNPTNKSND